MLSNRDDDLRAVAEEWEGRVRDLEAQVAQLQADVNAKASSCYDACAWCPERDSGCAWGERGLEEDEKKRGAGSFCPQNNELRHIADRTALEATRQAALELQKEREERHREATELTSKVKSRESPLRPGSKCAVITHAYAHLLILKNWCCAAPVLRCGTGPAHDTWDGSSTRSLCALGRSLHGPHRDSVAALQYQAQLREERERASEAMQAARKEAEEERRRHDEETARMKDAHAAALREMGERHEREAQETAERSAAAR